MTLFYEFICMAFPKAGAIYGGLPWNLSTVLLPFVLFININKILRFFNNKKIILAMIIEFFLAVLVIIFNMDSLRGIFLPASIIIVLAPYLLAVSYYTDPQKLMKIIIVSLLITGIYAVIQYVAGINKTAIYGLTIARGDNYSGNFIGYNKVTDSAIKMPSTYQNGNNVALFYVLAIPVLASVKSVELSKNWRILRQCAIIFGVIGLLMGGSRAATYPFIAVTLFNYRKVFKSIKDTIFSHKIGNVLFFIIVLCVIGFILCKYINFNEFFQKSFSRYVETTANDTTGSGRTVSFGKYWEYVSSGNIFEIISYILVGTEWSKGFDGDLLGMLRLFGLFFYLMFLSINFYPIIKAKGYGYALAGLLCLNISFIVDTTYFYTPSLFNYFLTAGLLMRTWDDMKAKEKMKNKELQKEKMIGALVPEH